MMIIRVVFLGVCVTVASASFTSKGYCWRPALLLDQYFDSYGNIPWEEEEARLDNFAIELQHDPNLIGYIMVYAGRHSCIGEAQEHALRAKNYIVKTRHIQENRVKLIAGGYQEEFRVILQPIPHGSPELIASPTIKPSNVTIKNCKPKTKKRKIRGS